MSEVIQGVASQYLQQLQDVPAFKQNQGTINTGKSFESYLQDPARPAGDPVRPSEPATSGVEMQKKLEQMQAELAEKFGQTGQDSSKINGIVEDLMNRNGGRLSMLKEAYGKMDRTQKVTRDLGGNLIKAENEWNRVQQIMHSNKDLSQGELLALQARLYLVSQHIEVMSKVVDQMAGGIKTVLNTNV